MNAPDPLFVGALANPQRWNRYAYARNNPLTLTDPTGLQDFRATAWPAAGGGDTASLKLGTTCNSCGSLPEQMSDAAREGMSDLLVGAGYHDWLQSEWGSSSLAYFGTHGTPKLDTPSPGPPPDQKTPPPPGPGTYQITADPAKPVDPGKVPWYQNSCITHALWTGAGETLIDSVGLIPLAGGAKSVARGVGNAFGFKGIVADQYGKKLISQVQDGADAYSLTSGVGGADWIGVSLDVVGLFPVLQQGAAVLSMGYDVYKTVNRVRCY